MAAICGVAGRLVPRISARDLPAVETAIADANEALGLHGCAAGALTAPAAAAQLTLLSAWAAVEPAIIRYAQDDVALALSCLWRGLRAAGQANGFPHCFDAAAAALEAITVAPDGERGFATDSGLAFVAIPDLAADQAKLLSTTMPPRMRQLILCMLVPREAEIRRQAQPDSCVDDKSLVIARHALPKTLLDVLQDKATEVAYAD